MPTKHYLQRKEANARYLSNLVRFDMYMKPETRAKIEAYAAAKGESLTGFFIRCASQEIARNPLEKEPSEP